VWIETLLEIVQSISAFLWQWRIEITILIVIGILLRILRFTIVKEGTAKAIMRLGGIEKMVMSWKGNKLDEDWNVVLGKAWLQLPGGLRFVGFWPIDKVHKYNFRWRGLELVGGKEQVEFHEKEIDYIQVRSDVYWTEIIGVETAKPERIPVNLEFLITVRAVNPYKALFKAPTNWNENMMARLNAMFTGWVSGAKKLDDLLSLRKKPETIWEELKDDPLVKMFKTDWGLEIAENGIELRAVTPHPTYQEAAARRRQMELEAEGTAAETVGTVIEMMARVRGKKAKTIQKEIETDEELKKEFLKLSKDLVVRNMGIKGKAYLDIRVQGASGIERMLLNALAAWQRMPKGGTQGASVSREGQLSEQEKRGIEEEVRKKRERRTRT